jgi:2-oxoglutarate dehydrogenase E2 component (dihydrolipoamide succinyltransferase)
MPTEVIMPQMGESIFEGTIVKWLKKAGDSVEKDEPLFEISTDKVDAEIPSPVAGVLAEIKVEEGATVTVNTVVAVVNEQGASNAQADGASHGESPATPGTAKASPAADPPAHTKTQAAPAAGQDAGHEMASGAVEIVMPQMGESIFEGTIVKWLKQVGDVVEKDEPLFEISTDKVDAEIPSPLAGILTEVRIPEGATVEINTVVAVVNVPGSANAQAAAPRSQSHGASPAKTAPAPPRAAAQQAPPESAAVDSSQRLRSSPLVRRMAKLNNIDLRHVPGTGSAGRITKEDIQRHLSERGPGNGPAAASDRKSAPPQFAEIPGELVPLTRMRSIIAQRMVESERTAPHVHNVFKIDMTRIVRLREREKARFEQAHGVKLTYMPFIAAAAIQALRKFPIINASLEQAGPTTGIRYHRNINLGIAVALDWGLIVPVVKQAEERSFLGIARAIADLAERARNKKLLPDEVSGNTFTLTNPGIFGDEFGLPIINQPDSAIMAIGALKKEPVVLTDAEGNDTIAIRSMQHFCLGFDHRIIDGADASRFMAEFKKTLEGWDKEIG